MIGQKLANRFELREEIGRGGMGVVYRARDPILRRDVAVKILPNLLLQDDARDRFEREAQLVAQLDHPGIVPVHDFGHHDGSLFFVMPLVAGMSLRALIQQADLALGEILEIGAQIAEALDYSHARGVIHRDIKPENIMLSERESDPPRVRLMDFGLALGGGQRLTKTGMVLGTMCYFSPEQASTEGTLDGRSDLYGVGTILYECLAGEPPFVGSLHAMVYRTVHEAPRGLRERGVEVDEGLERAILACLEKDPAARPQTGRELADRLRAERATLDEHRARHIVTRRPRSERPRAPGAPTFVGREQPLAELVARLDRAVVGGCQLVLLGGEAGVGKSRLLQELERLAGDRGMRTLRGRFTHQERTIPYQGFCELIQDYFRGRDSSAAAPRADLGDLADELLAVFPVLVEIGGLRSASTAEHPAASGSLPAAEAVATIEPAVLHELLARTLARLAAGKPLVLLLESLHAAEPAVAAVQYIARRLGPAPVLLVATYQPSETPRHHPLARLVAAVGDHPDAARIDLPPFDREETRRLVGSMMDGVVSAELVDRIFETTEGNAFFTVELMRALVDSGEVAHQQDTDTWRLSGASEIGSGALPATIQQAVARRVGRLPEPLQQLLRIATVLGRSFELGDLAALLTPTDPGEAAPSPVRDLDEAIDRLIGEGVLEEDRGSRGDRLAFASRMVREVLYGELPRRRRRSLHRRHARHLERRYAGRLERVYPQLVHHFCEGDAVAETVGYALALGHRALAGHQPEEAARAALTALELVAEGGLDEAAREGEVRLVLARSRHLAGCFAEAEKEAARAHALLAETRREGDAATAAWIAAESSWQQRRVENTVRWVEAGCEHARRALETDEDSDGSLGATLRDLLTLGATAANLRGRHDQAQLLLEEAESLVTERRRRRGILSAGPSAGQGGEGRDPADRGGRLVTPLPSPPRTFDPARATTAEDAEVLACVFEPLLGSAGEGRFVPALAESWRSSEDGRRFDVTLVAGATFSDGTPLDAAAVKLSFERFLIHGDPEIIGAYRVIRGSDTLLDQRSGRVNGIEVLDERRLCFHLSEPRPFFPALLTDVTCAIVRAREDGELIGTGPFRLAEHSAKRIVLAANRRYRDRSLPHLDAVEMRLDLDARAVARGLEEGTLDLGRDLPPDDLERLERLPRFRQRIVESLESNVYFVLFNTSGPSTRDPLLRRILIQATRVEDVVWSTLGRFAQPANCLIPPRLLGHDPGRRLTRLRREEALELLLGAQRATPIELRAAIHPILLDRYGSFTEALLADWSALGFEVVVTTTSMESYAARWRDSEGIDLLVGRWLPDYDDPDNLASGLFHSERGLFRRYYSSPTADAVISRARDERGTEARHLLYRRFEELLGHEHAVLPLFHAVAYRLAADHVEGVELVGQAPYVRYERLSRQREIPPSERRRPRGTLRAALPVGITSLDPVGANFVEEAEVVSCVLETLTRVDEGARVVPHLASEITTLEGGRRFRFRLRDGVHFHDGRRLTVRDVRYSFERLLHSEHPHAVWALLPVRGAAAYRDGEATEIAGLRILSASELDIELDEPLTFFPAMLTHPTTAIVPEGTDAFDGSYRQGAIGTGPFRVVRFDPGERLELEANPLYWRSGQPRTDRLIFQLAASAEYAAAAFREGQLSVVSKLRPQDVEELRRDPELASGYREVPGLSTYFLALAAHHGPLADPEVRRQLAHLLHGADLARTHAGRLAIPAHGLIAPGLLGHEPAAQPARPSGPLTEWRPSQASDRLVGLELRAFVHPVYLGPYGRLWEQIVETLGRAGVTLHVVHQSTAEMMGALTAGDIDLFATRWLADYPDADSFVSLAHPTQGMFGPILGNRALGALVERGRREADPAVRHGIYREIEQVIERQALCVPLFHEQVYYFARPEVAGLRVRMSVPEVAWEELSLRG